MLISAEPPLMVFISSIMKDDILTAREQLTNHIKNLMGLIPWTFEFTPASSEKVDEGYLRKVREADLVVWLVGNETTPPVQKEIRESLASNRKLLIFKMPVDGDRTRITQDLLSEVGLHAKYMELSSGDQLIEAFEKSLSDEMIRAYRGLPGMSRLARINEIYLESRARCLERWQAAGVTLEKAMKLFENKYIGEPQQELIHSLQKNKLVVLLGEFGSGKSLMAERLLQEYISLFINDSSKPIPLYIRTNNLFNDLSNEVERLSQGLGNHKIQGAFVVIDGIDEANLSDAQKIFTQARILAQSYPNTSVLLTSRPLPFFSAVEDKININLLSESKLLRLINEINNSELGFGIFYNLPPAIRSAIQRPFFAILWARYLRSINENQKIINTTGELLNFFIEDVIPFSDEKIKSSINILELLAVKIVDSGGDFVEWRQIGTYEEVNSLIETRLIQKISTKIGFSLPILAQWLAAHALVKDYSLIDDVVDNLARLDKWFYPLIIVVSMFPYEDVKRVFSPVVNKNPGLAAEIVVKGIDLSFYDEKNLLPSYKVCGERIRETYLTWISGIGNLSKYIAPISNDGNLNKIGITIQDNKVDVAWNNNLDTIDEISELPNGFFIKGMGNPGWYSVQRSTIGSQMAWPWRWSFDDLSKNLSKFISTKQFIIMNGYMYKERVWNWALDLMGYGNLYDNPIKLHDLETKLNHILNGQNSEHHTQFDELNYHFQNLRNNGVYELVPPWPSSDKKNTSGGWVWDPFSDDQILKRSKAIYSSALQEYDQLMTGIFNKLKPRMLIGTLLPVKMHGQLYFPDSSPFGRSPSLDWYFEPLPFGSKNIVNFELVATPQKMIGTQELYLLYKKMRPNSREWLSSFTHHGGLDIFGSNPITNIVYKWLESDLKSINWL